MTTERDILKTELEELNALAASITPPEPCPRAGGHGGGVGKRIFRCIVWV